MNDRPKQTRSLQKPSDAGRAEFGVLQTDNAPKTTRRAESALRHQGYRLLNRGMVPVCDRCVWRKRCSEYREGGDCEPIAAVHKEITEAIMQRPGMEPIDRPLVARYVTVLIFLSLLDLWLSQHGPFLQGAEEGYIELQPALAKSYACYAGLATRMAEALLLTPRARRDLRSDAAGRVGQALVRALRIAGPPVVDAEFSAEEEAGE